MYPLYLYVLTTDRARLLARLVIRAVQRPTTRPEVIAEEPT